MVITVGIKQTTGGKNLNIYDYFNKSNNNIIIVIIIIIIINVCMGIYIYIYIGQWPLVLLAEFGPWRKLINEPWHT